MERFSIKLHNNFQHFGDTEASLLKVFFAMEGKELGTCKTLLYIYQNPWHYITQKRNCHNHSNEIAKFHKRYKICNTTNITENTQKYNEVYSIFLPIFTVATDAETKFKHYRKVSRRESTPHSQFCLETH
jgi:hypothetical protein